MKLKQAGFLTQQHIALETKYRKVVNHFSFLFFVSLKKCLNKNAGIYMFAIVYKLIHICKFNLTIVSANLLRFNYLCNRCMSSVKNITIVLKQMWWGKKRKRKKNHFIIPSWRSLQLPHTHFSMHHWVFMFSLSQFSVSYYRLIVYLQKWGRGVNLECLIHRLFFFYFSTFKLLFLLHFCHIRYNQQEAALLIGLLFPWKHSSFRV